MKTRTWHLFPLILLTLIGYSTARGELLVHGTADMYWIAQVGQDQANNKKTIIRQRHIGGSPNWQLLTQINAPVVALANRGNDLAVLLESGDWMMLWPGGSSTGQLPEDGAKLLNLASSGDTFWAIAAARSGRAPTTAGATQPAATMPAGTLVLYRLEKGRWVMLAPLPGAAATAAQTSFAVYDGSPILALLTENNRIETFDFDPAQNNWRPSGSLPAPPETSHIKLLNSDRRLILWTGSELRAGAILGRNEAWSTPVNLLSQPDSLGEGVEDVTFAGQSIRLIAQGSGKIIENSYGTDGTFRGRIDLPGVIAPTGPGQFEWVTAVSAAALMFVLLNSFRQRTPTDLEQLAEKGINLAQPLKRLLAGILDALPIFGTGVAVISQFDPQHPADVDAMAHALRYPLLIASAVYILHVLVCEMIWGWSLGKKLFGLRVVMADGSKPNTRAIVLRNLLRVIDVSMMFVPTMLVIISPLRQRVGDVAAETIVVSDSPATPSEQKKESSED